MIYVQIKIWKAWARANRTEIHVGKFCVHQVLGKEPPKEERHSVLMLSFSLQGRFTTVSRAPVLPGEKCSINVCRAHDWGAVAPLPPSGALPM